MAMMAKATITKITTTEEHLNSIASSVHTSHDSFGFKRSTNGTPFSSSSTSSVSNTDRINELARSEAWRSKEDFHNHLPDSLVEKYDMRDRLALVEPDEINFGPLLGSGEYSNVFSIKSFQMRSEIDSALDKEDVDVRQYLKTHVKYDDTRKNRYAIKHIKKEFMETRGSSAYIQAAR